MPTSPVVSCCEEAVQTGSVFWVAEGNPNIGSHFGPARAGWTMIKTVALNFRGMYFLMNVRFCPFCGAELPRESSG